MGITCEGTIHQEEFQRPFWTVAVFHFFLFLTEKVLSKDGTLLSVLDKCLWIVERARVSAKSRYELQCQCNVFWLW